MVFGAWLPMFDDIDGVFECVPGVNDARLGQSSFAARGTASMPSPRLKNTGLG